jgi:hypothetical protein
MHATRDMAVVKDTGRLLPTEDVLLMTRKVETLTARLGLTVVIWEVEAVTVPVMAQERVVGGAGWPPELVTNLRNIDRSR